MTNSNAADPPVTILIVDDEEPLRNALARFLQKRGYGVLTASSGPEALERVKADNPGLMLLDVRMPGMSGIDVVPEALGLEPDLAVVMLSGVGDATTAALCMQRGAFDYLTKPIALPDLAKAVERALRKRDTILQEKGISTWLKEEVSRQSQELQLAHHMQDELVVSTLEALVNALEAKNSYFRGHSSRVAAFSATIATELDLADDIVEDIRIAGRLHDLGVIGVRDDVLEKQGPLTEKEFEQVKHHVTIGSRILSPLVHLGPVAELVRLHHERWDGSGYPDGIEGDGFPVGARIINAAETYDALTTTRPYREKIDPEKAVSHMREMAGKTIDPQIVEALAKAVSSHQTLIFIDEEHAPGA